ncbi:hypothetical protein LZ554_006476 [Drepanopeziza brunnea f. sp. 'monogermtubi']|nr:hypothetical protein LZ554_006476 [Drepanopeziza brunnea f. sp. 'monogermtubi']
MTFFPKSPRRRNWCVAVLATFIIAVIIAIAVPLAILIPNRGNGGQRSNVLLPLYIYPETNNTWSPLFDAVEARPELKFIVIVNPGSGPGLLAYPNDQYSASIAKLNSYANVQTVGYVRTGYASQNISAVVNEVSTYAGWSSNSSTLAMHGIFFDEAPHQYSAEAVEYMQIVNLAVKKAVGLQGDKTIIHNPGTVPDNRFNDPNTDITVVFEESYTAYSTKLSSLAALGGSRSQYCYMVHSAPTTGLKRFVHKMSERAEYLFVTDNTQDYYESFGADFSHFADVVPS